MFIASIAGYLMPALGAEIEGALALSRAMVEASGTKRLGTSADIANAVAFLLGSESSFITGTDILIDWCVVAALRSGRLTTPT